MVYGQHGGDLVKYGRACSGPGKAGVSETGSKCKIQVFILSPSE